MLRLLSSKARGRKIFENHLNSVMLVFFFDIFVAKFDFAQDKTVKIFNHYIAGDYFGQYKIMKNKN